LSVNEIANHFRHILELEGVKADDAVVRRVARLANGSMRDGLSLLDQLLSMGQSELTIEMIDDVLPTPHDEVLTRLIGQLADGDAGGALTTLDESLSAGYSLDRFAEALAEQIRTLMLLHVCGADTTLVDLPGAAREVMVDLSKRFDPEAYVYMIAVLEELRRKVRFSALGRPLVEAGIVRLASAVPYRSIQQVLDELGDAPAIPAKKKVTPAIPADDTAIATGRERETVSPAAPGQAPPPPVASGAPSAEELKLATSEPIVRKALELFDGSLVNVERIPEDQSPPESAQDEKNEDDNDNEE
jgi:DNA polymerase-3 subunit gamma/tau